MEPYRDFAIRVAQQAGKLLMENYGEMQQRTWKSKTDFKTQVDDQSDAYIRQEIRRAYPSHNIWSEEERAQEQGSEWTWVIDPLDGTLPYASGISDHFSVSIALARGKQPVLGVICAPLRNALYVAEKGRGSFCNGKTITVGEVDLVNKALVGIDYGKGPRTRALPYLERLLGDNGVTYPMSLACSTVPLCLVAQGKLQAYLHHNAEPWDLAAGAIIVQEAGGKVTTLTGGAWDITQPSILAANPMLHGKLLKLIHHP